MIEPKLTEVTATRQFEVTEKGRALNRGMGSRRAGNPNPLAEVNNKQRAAEVFIPPVVLGFGSVADAYGNCNQFRADASGGREMIA